MKLVTLNLQFVGLVGLLACIGWSAGADDRRGAGGKAQTAPQEQSLCETATEATVARPGLPPLPAGVTSLSFREFFKVPVGPRGLELTDRIRSLDGQRVRLLGYMVLQTDPTPGVFLFAPQPVKLHEHEYGFADELPASTVHVFLDTNAPPIVRFTPGPLLLTGKLAVGTRAETDGRISLFRLQLDPLSAEQLAANRQPKDAVPSRPNGGSPEHHGHSH